MNFKLDPADEAFRKEVQEFLRENLPADMAERNHRGYHFRRDDQRQWTRILYQQGWSAPNWPAEWGGPGWTQLRQFIFEEESALAGAPPLDPGCFKMFGPVIMTFGNEEMKARIREPILKGELFFGQGFSEPNAGSDLASLTTRAVRDGDEYVINGSKVWTSHVHESEILGLLVRTNPESRHGISMILVDVDAPGITIRPILDIGEGYSLNEVLLEDVRTPVANLVGEEGQGWNYAKFLLENERAFSAEVPRNKQKLMQLRRMAQQVRTDGTRLIDNSNFATRLAELEVDLQALEFLTLRALTEKAGGVRLPVGSLLKIRGSELLQKIGEMQVEALGDYASYFYPDPLDTPNGTESWPPGPTSAPGVMADFMYRRATTIYGGANEIQRTIIARSFLEL